jgi:hypothetical protein
MFDEFYSRVGKLEGQVIDHKYLLADFVRRLETLEKIMSAIDDLTAAVTALTAEVGQLSTIPVTTPPPPPVDLTPVETAATELTTLTATITAFIAAHTAAAATATPAA